MRQSVWCRQHGTERKYQSVEDHTRRGHTIFARGFTLIEVLVALAILAIGMAAVLGALSSSAGTLTAGSALNGHARVYEGNVG